MKHISNQIILTEKQNKRNQLFEYSRIKKKIKLEQDQIISQNNTTTSNKISLLDNNRNKNQQQKNKEITKKSKRKWRKLVPSPPLPPGTFKNRCNFLKRDKKKCKNKLYFQESTRITSNYCKSHIYMDKDSGFIQCKGFSRFNLQCLKPVLKQDIFCLKHLHSDYKDSIKKLKEKGVPLDDIINNKQWNMKEDETTLSEHNRIEKELQRINNNESIEFDDLNIDIPFEFKNNKTKRIEDLRSTRLQRIQQKQSKKQKNTKEKNKKIKRITSKIQKEQSTISKNIDTQNAPMKIPVLEKETIPENDIIENNNNNMNEKKFFNKVSNIFDELGWN